VPGLDGVAFGSAHAAPQETNPCHRRIRRFVDLHRGRFIDITIYVYREPASRPGPTPRIHWDLDSDALDTLDFAGVGRQ
jgi:hypothetical protein